MGEGRTHKGAGPGEPAWAQSQVCKHGPSAHFASTNPNHKGASDEQVSHRKRQARHCPSPHEYGNGKNAIGLTVDEFMTPLTPIVKSQFVTARAAARRMTAQRSGVILFLTGSPARGQVEGATAIGAAAD